MIVSAIVLNVRDFRENDRLLICYTGELGKIEIFVRSAKKITSKLTPLTSGLYALLFLTIESGKNHYHLIGGEIKKNFKSINSHYDKNIKTKKLFQIIDEIIKIEKSDQNIYNLIVKTLEKINSSPATKSDILIFAFIIKLLSFLGYKPEIKKCLQCQSTPKNKFYFDFRHGGIVCEKCADKKLNYQILINEGTHKILQALLYQSLDFLEKQSFAAKDFQSTQDIINRFLQWHLK